MLRLTSPAALETGYSKTAAPRSRPAQTRQRALHSRRTASVPAEEVVDPADLELGQLFVHTREAVIVGNLETGRIALWNPAAERLFGYTASEAIGKPIEMLMPPPIATLHSVGIAQFRRTGHGGLVGSGTAIEVPALTRDGQEIRVELSLAPVEAAGRRATYVMALLRDVSDRKRAEMQGLEAARADAARAEAERALSRRDELLRRGMVALRSDTRKLQRSAARLERTTEPDRANLLARVVSGRAEALARSMELLADVAAIESGTLEIQPERVNLVPLLGRVVAEARARSTVHRLRLAMPQGLTAPVDAARIEQVIRLLLEQACRRNARGCWIDVELRRPLVGVARLEVRDYGRPLSRARRERLAAEGARGEPWLSVCRFMAEKHGGALSLEYPAEGGLRVIVTLPTQPGRVLGAAV